MIQITDQPTPAYDLEAKTFLKTLVSSKNTDTAKNLLEKQILRELEDYSPKSITQDSTTLEQILKRINPVKDEQKKLYDLLHNKHVLTRQRTAIVLGASLFIGASLVGGAWAISSLFDDKP